MVCRLSRRSVPQACQSATPPEPTEAAWSSVLKRIDERTQIIKAKNREQDHLLELAQRYVRHLNDRIV